VARRPPQQARSAGHEGGGHTQRLRPGRRRSPTGVRAGLLCLAIGVCGIVSAARRVCEVRYRRRRRSWPQYPWRNLFIRRVRLL